MEEATISVVMAVYNTEENYLREAIESILQQTYKNFEFIIVDDGSGIETKKILREYTDKRIKIIENIQNVGLTKSLNIALKCAKGKYIARMDADDVSYPERFEKQLKYMETHLEVGVLGSWTSNNLNKKINRWRGNIPSEYRRVEMLFGNSGICHSTAFIRKSILDTYEILYNEDIKKAQDYELWTRILKYCEMQVYPEVLLLYRIHEKQITTESGSQQEYYRDLIRQELFYQIYPEGKYMEKELFLSFGNVTVSIEEMEQLLCTLEKQNIEKEIYDIRFFRFQMIRAWSEWILPQFFKKKDIHVLFRKNIYKISEPGYLIWRMKMYILMYFV